MITRILLEVDNNVIFNVRQLADCDMSARLSSDENFGFTEEHNGKTLLEAITEIGLKEEYDKWVMINKAVKWLKGRKKEEINKGLYNALTKIETELWLYYNINIKLFKDTFVIYGHGVQTSFYLKII